MAALLEARRQSFKFAMAKTVPRNWAGRRAEKPARKNPRGSTSSASEVALGALAARFVQKSRILHKTIDVDFKGDILCINDVRK